jgi:hypothetical protein
MINRAFPRGAVGMRLKDQKRLLAAKMIAAQTPPKMSKIRMPMRHPWISGFHLRKRFRIKGGSTLGPVADECEDEAEHDG